MDEGAALEMLCRGNSTVGSNPTLSASFYVYYKQLTQHSLKIVDNTQMDLLLTIKILNFPQIPK